MKGPVVLLGPSGAGKSTAGREAARLLQMRFVDLDDVVGDPTAIFAEEGEASFRARELLALDGVLDGADVLVAAGAGIVDTAPARRLLQERALAVRLVVDAPTALARLAASPRPWLSGDDGARAQQWEERDAPRRRHRASLAPLLVDGAAPLASVAAQLADTVGKLRPIGAAALAPEVHFDEGLTLPPDAILVVEEVIARLHPEVADHPRRIVVGGGEGAKALASVEALSGALLEHGITRDSLVVGMGGGALLDVVGLACALTLRGVRWWAVPTTLLAQVDAGVGGKTAVNFRGKKNLLGAFHPPQQTLIARRFLATLDDAALRAGRAEMLKHELLAADAPVDGSPLIHDDDIARALSIKLAVVRRDPRERGLRAALNLGHTVAHGLEATMDIAHGEAVRHGLLAMLRLSVAHAGLLPGVARVLESRVRALGPLVPITATVDAIVDAIASDKKRTTTGVRFVLLRAPGLPVGLTPPVDSVRDAVRALLP